MSVSRLRSGALVEARAVGRRYGWRDSDQWALRDASLTIAGGSVVAITGASGSGKSTLIHLLAGYDRPDDGAVLVDGLCVSSLRGRALDRHRRRVGVVLQQSQLLAGVSVLGNVLAPTLPIRRVDFDRRARALELLTAVGLEHRDGDSAGHLSLGERQRVAIARALIWRPTVLLADEPTAGLDSSSSRSIVDGLLTLHQRFAMTLLIATHHHQVAARCDRIVSLGDGRVIDDHILRAERQPAEQAVASGGSVTPMPLPAGLRATRPSELRSS